MEHLYRSNAEGAERIREMILCDDVIDDLFQITNLMHNFFIL